MGGGTLRLWLLNPAQAARWHQNESWTVSGGVTIGYFILFYSNDVDKIEEERSFRGRRLQKPKLRQSIGILLHKYTL